MTRGYLKHIVQCRCFLHQFKHLDNPPSFQFPVFTQFNEETGEPITTYAQCPNCGLIHKVKEIGKSEILHRETMMTLPTYKDIKREMPEWLSGILEEHSCDFATWQEAKHIYTNQLWGNFIVLAREREDDTLIGKCLFINGKDDYHVEVYTHTDEIEIE